MFKTFFTKKIALYLTPIAFGILLGVIILLVYPSAGRNVGNILYSSNLEVESYSYAAAVATPSVVNVYVTRLNNQYSYQMSSKNELITSASGVIMRKDGYIVTNYHVITSVNQPNATIFIQTNDGTIYPAFVVGYDRRTDLAVLKVQQDDLPPIRIDEKYEPKVGDVVLAIGNPNNLGQTITHGIISSTARSGTGLVTKDQMSLRDGYQDLIQTDAPINRGNSGGALVNTNGVLAGINTASFNDQQSYGLNFAVPAKLVVHIMDEIITHGRVTRGYLGISDDGVQELPDNAGIGIIVGYIDPIGPAANSDLQVGDLIVAVDGAKVESLRSVIDKVSSTPPGKVMQFSVLRNGDTITIPIALTEDQIEIN